VPGIFIPFIIQKRIFLEGGALSPPPTILERCDDDEASPIDKSAIQRGLASNAGRPAFT
jgi:hypothetical protein